MDSNRGIKIARHKTRYYGSRNSSTHKPNNIISRPDTKFIHSELRELVRRETCEKAINVSRDMTKSNTREHQICLARSQSEHCAIWHILTEPYIRSDAHERDGTLVGPRDDNSSRTDGKRNTTKQ